MFKVKRLSSHRRAHKREMHLHDFDTMTDTESAARNRSDAMRRSSFSGLRPSHTVPLSNDDDIIFQVGKGSGDNGDARHTDFLSSNLLSKSFGSTVGVLEGGGCCINMQKFGSSKLVRPKVASPKTLTTQ